MDGINPFAEQLRLNHRAGIERRIDQRLSNGGSMPLIGSCQSSNLPARRGERGDRR